MTDLLHGLESYKTCKCAPVNDETQQRKASALLLIWSTFLISRKKTSFLNTQNHILYS